MPFRLTLALAVASACGCATAPDRPQSDRLAKSTLKAGPRNAGETGQAVMAAEGDMTALTLLLSGVPPWVSRPVQLYTFIYGGSCVEHGATAAFALNDIVQAGLFSNNASFGPFTLKKSVPLPLNELRTGGYAVIVRTSAADGNVDLFCGDLN